MFVKNGFFVIWSNFSHKSDIEVPKKELSEFRGELLHYRGKHIFTVFSMQKSAYLSLLKVHKNEKFFGLDFEFRTFLMLVMHE